jgi:hypothetical protein
MKTIIFILITLVTGFVGGYFTGEEFGSIGGDECETIVENISELNAMAILQNEQNQMMEAYTSDKPDVGIFMIRHGIEWMNTLKANNLQILGKQVLDRDIAISYIRLAKLHKESGDNIRHNELVKQAVEIYRSTGSEVGEENLLSLVENMDKQAKEKIGGTPHKQGAD